MVKEGEGQVMQTRDLSLTELNAEIEALRIKMNKVGNQKGYNHVKTVWLSQKLDYLLNTYRRMLNNKETIG